MEEFLGGGVETVAKGYRRYSRAITKRGRRTILGRALEFPFEAETEVAPSLAMMGVWAASTDVGFKYPPTLEDGRLERAWICH